MTDDMAGVVRMGILGGRWLPGSLAERYDAHQHRLRRVGHDRRFAPNLDTVTLALDTPATSPLISTERIR